MKPSTTVLLASYLLFIFFLTPSLADDRRFIDNRDGTVTDSRLGLMWSASDNQGDINWHQAEKWVRYTFPYTLPKVYDNWRLPSPAELKSLYEAFSDTKGYRTGCGHRVKIEKIQLSCGWVWSSETRSISAMAFNYQHGHFFLDRKSRSRGYRALAVRDI